jgi:hypothetical protein
MKRSIMIVLFSILTIVAFSAVLAVVSPATTQTTEPSTTPATVPTTSPATVPATKPIALNSVFIRNTDTQSPTTRAAVDGGYVVQSALPAHWTLQFNFTAQPQSVRFTLDGKQPHVENFVPWVVEGDNNPINLPLGDHVVTYAVNSVNPTTFHISIMPSPLIGTNLEGISYAQGDPVVHPQLLTTAQGLRVQTARFWIEGSWSAKITGNYFHVTQAWQKAGVKVIAVANYQNSVPRCSAPTDAVWTAYWTAFPSPAQTGIYAIDLGNEVNTSNYYTGTPSQLAHLMALAYPILHAKGYVVCAPSVLNSLNWYQQLQKLNAFNDCDRIDVHSYAGSAASVVVFIDQGIAFGRSIGRPCDASEWGVRMSASNKPAWAAQTAAVYSLLQTRSGWFNAFSFYPTADPLDQATPLDKNYNANEPFHSAILGAVGGK